MQFDKRKIALIIFALIAFSLLFAMPVFAGENCPICGNAHNLSKLTVFQKMAYDTSCSAYGGDIMPASLTKILGVGSGSLFSQILPTIYACYDAMLPIGLTLLCVYFAMSFFEDFSVKDIGNGEQIIFWLMKLIIAAIIMYMGKDIITAILDGAQGIFEAINSYSSSTSVTIRGDCIYNELVDMGKLNIWTPFVIVLGTIIPSIMVFVLSVCINVAAASKMLELGVRIIFAPIGMSDIYLSGTHGKGFRYLKSLLAVALEGSVMLMIMLVYRSVVSDAALFGGTISLFTSIVLGCVAVVGFFKCREVARSMLGV